MVEGRSGRHGFTAVRVLIPFLCLCAFCGVTASAQVFQPTANLLAGRFAHSAEGVTDGRVLVAGGKQNPTCVALRSAEIYAPETGTWSRAADMSAARMYFTLTRLPDGKILAAGGVFGVDSCDVTLFGLSAEVYDPSTDAWAPLPPVFPRAKHTATLLSTGEVLVTGGIGPGQMALNTAEIFDPGTGAWTSAGALSDARYDHAATLLPDGRVLVTGGRVSPFLTIPSAEIFDPATKTWSSAGALGAPRAEHQAVSLGSGLVLVSGGNTGSMPLSSAEVFDSGPGISSSAPSMSVPRASHTATILPNGKVLVAGGSPGLASTELFDPGTGTWSAGLDMTNARYGHTATLLKSGAVLVAAGQNQGPFGLATAELYLPPPTPAPVAKATATPNPANEGVAVTLDATGSVGEGLSYQWTQVAPPACPAALSNPTSPQATFTAPYLGGGFGSCVMTFQLTVTNASGSATASVDVTDVNVNHAPEAKATDQTVTEGSPVTLDGSSSYDPDTDPITYQWTQTGGTAVALADADTAKASFTAPMLGGGVGGGQALTFALTVSDGALSQTAMARVVVEQVDHPPVANAGPAQTVKPGATVGLDGSLSFDPDNDAISYQWVQVAGPSVALSAANVASPRFTAPSVSGVVPLTFRLVVSDGLMRSQPSDTVVTIKNENSAPVCSLAQAVPNVLWPPNHKMIPIKIVGVTDPEDGQVAVSIVRVTQDEMINGLGDGDTSPDAILQGEKVLLRAERSGTGNGRVYQIHFTASDGQGGVCSGAVSVAVPHDQKPGDPIIDDGQNYSSLVP
jgi:hypothetical protein